MKLKIIPNQQTPKVKISNKPLLLMEDRKLLEKFLWFSQQQFNCAGLASNQVSVNGDRIMEQFFSIKNIETVFPFWELIIHPTILNYVGEPETKIEGCLTWIGKDIIAKRYHEIEVEYYTLKCEKVRKKITGFMAQVWQHEYNHLMGVEEKVVDRVKK